MALREDQDDFDKVNKVLIKQYSHVKFSMKDGKRYLGLPDSPVSENDSDSQGLNSASLALAKARMAKRNFKNGGSISPVGSQITRISKHKRMNSVPSQLDNS